MCFCQEILVTNINLGVKNTNKQKTLILELFPSLKIELSFACFTNLITLE